MMRDLRDRHDVETMVGEFYERAFADPLIGPIFTEIAVMDLGHHLPIMCDFWETVLFRAGKYKRNAFQLHVALNDKFPLEQEHFDRWLEIWVANVDESFAGQKAEAAKTQARRIAYSIHRRLHASSRRENESVSPRSVQAGL
ncbi:group III truncated hemoglobin [Rhodococcus sp. 1168]|uniref:group III truncated hemoglobin n=1 Tax=Rhodococcus sp. 1168 TaxID=2018041 RepID=UPI001C385A66|nr:group III truncated hemoglobin [Rhodococcus sp. 1168]